MSEYLSHLSVEELNRMLASAITEGLTNRKIADIQCALGKAEYSENQKRIFENRQKNSLSAHNKQ